MRKMIILTSILYLFLLCGCYGDIEPINYGKDQCGHCKMTIVDEKYGAEIITTKGKVMKFDAAECLINHLNKNNIDEFELKNILVTDFTSPRTFIDAIRGSFLVSPKLRSPMGENITSFSDNDTAEKFKMDFGGEIYDWQGIKKLLAAR